MLLKKKKKKKLKDLKQMRKNQCVQWRLRVVEKQRSDITVREERTRPAPTAKKSECL